MIPKPVKKLEKLFIAPKVRQVLYETSQRVFTRSACQKSLAEFAARRRQIKWNHFLPGRVPGKKHFSVCKCGICSLSANKLCARQTASLLFKKGFALFGPSCQKSFLTSCVQNCKIEFCIIILQFCRCGGWSNAKGHPDGFLSHFPSLRDFRLGRFL